METIVWNPENVLLAVILVFAALGGAMWLAGRSSIR